MTRIDSTRAKQRLLVIGAHPDDAEFHAGGLMQQWVSAGHEVRILCLTDGGAGHHAMPPAKLVEIRKREAAAAASLLGAELEVWDTADGTLQPTLQLRHELIRAIRSYAPDLIVTHRPADYHPDHRATAQLVQDACYLLQVPNVAPDVPALAAVPPVLLAWDHFTYPRPFRGDWVIDTTAVLDAVVALLDCHASQVYEWLPHTQGVTAPTSDRLSWLKQWYASRPAHVAKRFAADEVEYAEAFEVSEYGGTFDAASLPMETVNI